MAVTITTLFAPSQLTGSAAVIYAVPTSPPTTVLSGARVRFTNTDTNARAITAYAVSAGGSPSLSNIFMDAETVGPNSHIDIDVPLLGPGGTLQAFADVASKVTVLALDGILFS